MHVRVDQTSSSRIHSHFHVVVVAGCFTVSMVVVFTTVQAFQCYDSNSNSKSQAYPSKPLTKNCPCFDYTNNLTERRSFQGRPIEQCLSQPRHPTHFHTTALSYTGRKAHSPWLAVQIDCRAGPRPHRRYINTRPYNAREHPLT
jgi:hypothetical protein